MTGEQRRAENLQLARETAELQLALDVALATAETKAGRRTAVAETGAEWRLRRKAREDPGS